MKSVMHEASTLAKAIEQGWEKAGKPVEFKVKVLEEAQKNFIGMTTRSAKIALFFDEKPVAREQRPTQQTQNRQPKKQKEHVAKEFTSSRPQQAAPVKPARQQETEEAPKQRTQKQFAPLWNDAMVALTQDWMSGTLKTMGLGHVGFVVQPQNFHLRITFNKQLLEDANKEKQLLASFSTLILETLKSHFRMGFRGHKIVLTHSNE